jgi:hypothetical protein
MSTLLISEAISILRELTSAKGTRANWACPPA